ncbi:MAG: alpha-D-ribose 1-methylphosphonate 5-triphosphate diphosphatase, partial [Actinobacteria bacterium]|nr:alpha-D-ribose 1-methylphosphonate 5-triphosphate diphosphatase [Actinomycetota bacterium]
MSGATFAVRNVTAVLPDALLENAVVVVENGVITDVSQGAAPSNALDGHGSYCLPGLVDTHNDGLEREVMPRPSTRVPVEFALRAFESRIRAAGITTLFHGISWENDLKWNRTVELAKEFSLHITDYRESDSSLIDHRLLHRLDARDGDGSVALREYLDSTGAPSDFGGDTPLVSFEDHTPGQGQYTDRSGLVRYLMGTRGLSAEQAEIEVEKNFQEREA